MKIDNAPKNGTRLDVSYSDWTVYLVPDERGESESYEAVSLVAMVGEHVVWVEGVRKDRANMIQGWRAAIDAALAK